MTESRIVILREAEEELFEAEQWYEQQRSGLGAEFLDEVSETIDRISAAPNTSLTVPGTSLESGVRRLLVRRFPFSAVFVQHAQETWVIAFAHDRKRPGYWRHRLP